MIRSFVEKIKILLDTKSEEWTFGFDLFKKKVLRYRDIALCEKYIHLNSPKYVLYGGDLDLTDDEQNYLKHSFDTIKAKEFKICEAEESKKTEELEQEIEKRLNIYNINTDIEQIVRETIEKESRLGGILYDTIKK